MKKPFKDSATARDIMRTGWLMGFEVEQTYKELRVMGYYRDSIAILMQWGKWEKEMQERFNNGN